MISARQDVSDSEAVQYKDLIEKAFESLDFKGILTETEKKQVANVSDISNWGDFGWVLSPLLDLVFYKEIPSSQDEADQRIIARLNQVDNNQIIDGIVSCIYGSEELKKEAAAAYRNGLYHSCVLDLFALIDEWIITTQDKLNSDNRRQGGKKAIGRLDANLSLEELTWRALIFDTCKKALLVFFRDTTNFQEDSNPLVCRHQLMHGMWQKRLIEDTDCIRLFWLYENLLFCKGYDTMQNVSPPSS